MFISSFLGLKKFLQKSKPKPAVIDYYEERAKGGAGLIITTSMTPANGVEYTSMSHDPFQSVDAFLVQTKKLADKVHAYDTKIFISIGVGFGRNMFPDIMTPAMNNTPVAPSAIPNRWNPSLMCRETTAEELRRISESLIKAASIAKQSGVDGIILDGIYGGYFTDQYATKIFNLRKDEYGYEQNGQLKMLIDTIKGVKATCGENFPICTRVTPKHYKCVQ